MPIIIQLLVKVVDFKSIFENMNDDLKRWVVYAS
jgi:hypothetical protein